MSHAVQPLPFKPSRLKGLSERLLASHYENNYGGAVRRLNAIDQRLAALDWDKAPVFEINGLKREQLIAANSMILHEIYFEGLGGTGEPGGDIAVALERDFGSVGAWRREFVAMGKAQAGGSGWVLLSWSPRIGRLVNQWAADHAHCLGDGAVILALDMYEHAYHLDFGARAAAYVDAFMANIHWDRIGARLDHVTAAQPRAAATVAPADPIAAGDVQAMLARNEGVVLLDVRQDDDLAKASDMLPGAFRVRPEELDQRMADLPKDRPIVAYCVYGFQVSGDAVAALRQRGFDARALSGGIASWHAMGFPTIPKS